MRAASTRRLAAAAFLCGALPAPATAAAAQRLDYDMTALSRPRLDYDRLDEVGTLAVPPPASNARQGAASSRPAVAAERARVREFYLDQMEYALQPGADGYAWDVAARIGGPRHRLWLGSIGEGTLGGALDYLETQALYSRAVSDAWDVQAGVRYDLRPRPSRIWATVGGQGNASDALYLGAFGFVSHRGELAARLFALYDLPIVGRLILQPSVEADIYGQDIEDLGIGAGPSYGEAALRLRYRFSEAFGPYAGLVWSRALGRTAQIAREAGEEPGSRSFVLGLRSWF